MKRTGLIVFVCFALAFADVPAWWTTGNTQLAVREWSKSEILKTRVASERTCWIVFSCSASFQCRSEWGYEQWRLPTNLFRFCEWYWLLASIRLFTCRSLKLPIPHGRAANKQYSSSFRMPRELLPTCCRLVLSMLDILFQCKTICQITTTIWLASSNWSRQITERISPWMFLCWAIQTQAFKLCWTEVQILLVRSFKNCAWSWNSVN